MNFSVLFDNDKCFYFAVYSHEYVHNISILHSIKYNYLYIMFVFIFFIPTDDKSSTFKEVFLISTVSKFR